MARWLKLIVIGVLAGAILASVLLAVYFWTDNMAYYLLFNVDYIPLLKDLQPKIAVEIVFHFVFCMASVVCLFYLLSKIDLERRVTAYVLVYTGGSAVLFLLTGLSDHPPLMTDLAAWLYWSAAHALYSVIVGLLVKKWV